jgi:muramoyltetrapeptide carboxypeptidase LdcA involved in peptidoglycan recycling
MLPTSSYGGVFFAETSEEMPSSEEVYRMLRNLGERGLLERFEAILWGRPKSTSLFQELTPEQSVAYVTGQYLAVDRALAEYNPTAVVVKGLDIGHTDPQLILPYGGEVRINPAAERITVVY